MKLIVAIIRPEILPCVQLALKGFEIDSMTLTETHDYGQEDGHVLIYRSSEIRVRTSPKLRLEIVVNDFDADEVFDAILSNGIPAKGNLKNGCKVYILPLDQFVDVSTGQHEALPALSR